MTVNTSTQCLSGPLHAVANVLICRFTIVEVFIVHIKLSLFKSGEGESLKSQEKNTGVA